MEDQEIMDQFLEHRQQNYVIDNMNAEAGCGGIEVAAVVSSGVKYDEQLQTEEHDVGDDDEWKYVKEVQQSEKQQSVKDFGDYTSNELAENEGATYKYEIGNGAVCLGGDFKDVGKVMNIFGNTNSNGHETQKVEDQNMEDLDSRPIDFDIKAPISHDVVSVQQADLGDDEEPSSIATNGTSSLSENVVQHNPFVDGAEDSVNIVISNADNKEESVRAQQRLDIDIEQTQWQLNPEAKEFVPNFGSNPTSPISPHHTEFEPSNIENTMEKVCFFGQASAAVPHRIMVDDDFVAQSPRKGRCGNMDTISLPAEQEFDEEADQRPHELEQDDVEKLDIGVDNSAPVETTNLVSTNDNVAKDNIFQCDADFTDFETSKIIDHGPETCVDLDADTNKQPYKEFSVAENDIMKQSIYVTNDEPIEDVLNSVQPIPTEIDSVNNSFTEDLLSSDSAGDKEQLQVEEKEHISNSPSTEEMQMHLQPNEDILLISNDTNDDVAMQGSFYVENEQPLDVDNSKEEMLKQTLAASDINQMMEGGDILSCSIEETNIDNTKSDKSLPSPDAVSGGINEQIECASDYVTQSSYMNEKHLFEETKEIPISSNEKHLFEETKETSMSLTDSDIKHPMEKNSQPEEVAASFAVTTTEDKSDCFNKPDGIGDICEQITTSDHDHQEIAQHEIESSKIVEDVRNEFTEQPQFDVKNASTISSTTNTEDMEGCSSVVAEDLPPAYHSENLVDVEPTAPLAENINAPTALENVSSEPSIVLSVKPQTNDTEIIDTLENTLKVQDISLAANVQSDVNELSTKVVEDLECVEPSISLPDIPQGEGQRNMEDASLISHVQSNVDDLTAKVVDGVIEEKNNSDDFKGFEPIMSSIMNPLDIQQEDNERHNLEDTSLITHVQSNVDELTAKVVEGVITEQTMPEVVKCITPTISPVEKINIPSTFESLSTSPALLAEPECIDPENMTTMENVMEMLERDDQRIIEDTFMKTHEESNIFELSAKVVDGVPSKNNFSEEIMSTISSVENMNSSPALDSHTTTELIPEAKETETIKTTDDPLEKTEEVEENTIEDTSVEAHIDELTAKVVGDIAAAKPSDNIPSIACTAATAPTTKVLPHSTAKKPEDIKKTAPKTASSTSKAKPSSSLTSTSKKTTATETLKKPIGVAAKPRLPPPKSTTTTSTATDKKPNKQMPAATTTARKAISSATTVSKVATKTSSTTSTTRSTSTTMPATKAAIPSRPTAARTVTSATAARKPIAAPSATSAKSRPASATGVTSAPSKPTTLGVSSATSSSARTKVTSPRATLTSQARKITPGSIGAKSPVKSTTLNSVTKTVTSTLGNRTKAPSSTVQVTGTTTTTVNKTSTRPAVKITSSATTCTSTRRLTHGGTTTSSTLTTQTTSKATSSTLRKSSPIKSIAGKTPTKSTNSLSGAKTVKSTTKITPTKSTEHKSNGDGKTKESELNGNIETSPVALTVEDDHQNADTIIIPSINDPSTVAGSTDHMQVDLISA